MLDVFFTFVTLQCCPALSISLSGTNPLFSWSYFSSFCLFLAGGHFSLRSFFKNLNIDLNIVHLSQYLIAVISASFCFFFCKCYKFSPQFYDFWKTVILFKFLDASVSSGIILPAAVSWQKQCGLQAKQPQKLHRRPEDYCICWIIPAIRSFLKEKYWFK